MVAVGSGKGSLSLLFEENKETLYALALLKS